MNKKNRKLNLIKIFSSIIILLIIILFGTDDIFLTNKINQNDMLFNSVEKEINFDLSTIPQYSTSPFIELNNNIPYFSEEDFTTNPFEKYSPLDDLGRCGVAYANICKDIMPSSGDERGNISSVIPSGWKQKEYDGKYLYHRCHLIGYQLSDEDANELNLITGTEYLNIEGMLPFENKIAEYVEDNPGNHVLYRVTPIFEGNNLVANGVQMEALSIEDNGQGICFNIYCYNVQPGIEIDYKTGESKKI